MPQDGAGAAASSARAAPSQPPMASLSMDAGPATVDEGDGLGRATLTDEERAALQAQLALLSAQLSELAQMELDAEEVAPAPVPAPAPAPAPVHVPVPTVAQPVTVPSQPLQQPLPLPTQAPPPPPIQAAPDRIIIDVNHSPDELTLASDVEMQLADFNLEAAVNSIAELAAKTAREEVEAEDPMDEDDYDGEDAGDKDAEPTQEEDSSEDEDMEMVDVDSYMQKEGLRT